MVSDAPELLPHCLLYEETQVYIDKYVPDVLSSLSTLCSHMPHNYSATLYSTLNLWPDTPQNYSPNLFYT